MSKVPAWKAWKDTVAWKNVANKFPDLLFKDFQTYTLEQRFLALIPCIASLLTFLSVFVCLFLHNDYSAVVCLVSAAIYAVSYLVLRFWKTNRLAAWIMILNTLALVDFIWFQFEGSKGAALPVILVLLISVMMFFRKAEKFVGITLVMINLSFLLYAELFYPELIRPYVNNVHRILDIFITSLMCGVFMMYLISGILKSYHQEKVNAENASKLKSAFLANISHEIRTPMNAIMGFSSLLTQDDVSLEERNLYNKYITNSCQVFSNLINNIIDISEIESKQFKNIHKSSCSANDILRYVYEYFKNDDWHHIYHEVDFYPAHDLTGKDIYFETDCTMIKQVLINLIDNALKFTHKGHVKFGCRQQQHEIIFFVKDTGIGISEDKHQYIFDSFSKVQQANKKLYRGAGLGLTISRNLIGLLGGKIWLESEEHQGSVFYFSVPYKPVAVHA